MGPGFFLAIKQNQDREKRRDRQREKEEWWLYQRGVENLARDLRMKSTSYLCTRTSTDNIHHQYLSCKQLLLLTLSYLTKSARRKTHTKELLFLSLWISVTRNNHNWDWFWRAWSSSRLRLSHQMELHPNFADTQQKQKQHFHVLAVDDSLIERKLLERLLTESSCKGIPYMSVLSLQIINTNLCTLLHISFSSS